MWMTLVIGEAAGAGAEQHDDGQLGAQADWAHVEGHGAGAGAGAGGGACAAQHGGGHVGAHVC